MTHRKLAPTGEMPSRARPLNAVRPWSRADSAPSPVATPLFMEQERTAWLDGGLLRRRQQRWAGAGAALVALAGLCLLWWQPIALITSPTARVPAAQQQLDRPSSPTAAPAGSLPDRAPWPVIDLSSADWSGVMDPFADLAERLGLRRTADQSNTDQPAATPARNVPNQPVAAPARDAVVPVSATEALDGGVSDTPVRIQSRFLESTDDTRSPRR